MRIKATALFAIFVCHATADDTSSLLEEDTAKPGIFGTQYHESFGLVYCPDKTIVNVPRFGLKPPANFLNSEEDVPLFRDNEKLRNPDGDYMPYPADGIFDSPIIALRIQDQLLIRGRDRKPANFNWQQNRISDSTSADVEAAVILDLYTPGNWLFEYDPQASAYRTTAGVGWERNTATGSERDVRKFYLGSDFDILPRLLDRLGARSRQPGSIGLIYEQDVISDEERLHLDLDWAPVTGLLSQILGDKDSTLWIGRRSYFKGFFDLIEEEEINIEGTSAPQVASNLTGENQRNTLETARSYFYFRPDIGFELGGGATIGDVIDDFDSGFFRYGFETGIGFRDDLVKLTYSLESLVPLNSGRQGHTFQEVSIDFSARHLPMTVSTSYQRGERSPDFKEEDLVKFGVTFKL